MLSDEPLCVLLSAHTPGVTPFVLANLLASGEEPRRWGTAHPDIVPYQVFAARDGYLVIAVGNDAQFAKCAAVLGHPEWASDARFTKNRDRVANRALVDGMIGEALARQPSASWIGKLQAVGVPCGPINTVAQAIGDPHTAARGMVETVSHATIGELKMLGIPFKFGATPAAVRRPPPTLGQHTSEILSKELGMDEASINALREQKII
jgi:crotonobetainyl-CoA:carnitine CoA-transferase CaiB-like acyl-CoA transferase